MGGRRVRHCSKGWTLGFQAGGLGSSGDSSTKCSCDLKQRHVSCLWIIAPSVVSENILDEASNVSIFFLKLQILLKKKWGRHKESQTSCLWESSISIKALALEQARAIGTRENNEDTSELCSGLTVRPWASSSTCLSFYFHIKKTGVMV